MVQEKIGRKAHTIENHGDFAYRKFNRSHFCLLSTNKKKVKDDNFRPGGPLPPISHKVGALPSDYNFVLSTKPEVNLYLFTSRYLAAATLCLPQQWRMLNYFTKAVVCNVRPEAFAEPCGATFRDKYPETTERKVGTLIYPLRKPALGIEPRILLIGSRGSKHVATAVVDTWLEHPVRAIVCAYIVPCLTDCID